MSEEGDSDLEEEEVVDVGFGEVEFSSRDDSGDPDEIKIGFEEEPEEEEHEDLDDEDLKEFLSLDFITDLLDSEDFVGLDLEGILSDGIVRERERGSEDGNFYKVRDEVGGTYEVYDGDTKNDYEGEVKSNYDEGFVDINDVNVSVESSDGRRQERSILEISGFRDMEAEKKRKEKRERFW